MPLVEGSIPGPGMFHALNIRDCVSLCLSEETLKAVGPFYLVSMPGEVKYPTQGVNRQIPCFPLSTTPVLAQRWAVRVEYT